MKHRSKRRQPQVSYVANAAPIKRLSKRAKMKLAKHGKGFATQKADPSRTMPMVKAFQQKLQGQFALLKERILKQVGEQDMLGLGAVDNANLNHDEKGRFAESGDSEQGIETNHIPTPKTQKDADKLGRFLRDQWTDYEGDEFDDADHNRCLDASLMVKAVFPNTIIYRGVIPGNYEEGGEHKVAKVGEYFYDLTSKQFFDDADHIVFHEGDVDDIYTEYAGFKPLKVLPDNPYSGRARNMVREWHSLTINCQPGQLRGADGRCGPGIGLGIDRNDMPQIPKDKLPQFIQWCRQQGVGVSEEQASVHEMQPVQQDFRQERVDAIPDDAMTQPIIVCRADGVHRILDGTHRWVKAWQGGVPTLLVIALDLPVDDALQLMWRFQHVKFAANLLLNQLSDDADDNALYRLMQVGGSKEIIVSEEEFVCGGIAPKLLGPITNDLSDVPDVQQRKTWDCGPAALKAAADSLGVVKALSDWTRLLDTDEDGTSPDGMLQADGVFGLEMEEHHGMTIVDLARLTGSGDTRNSNPNHDEQGRFAVGDEVHLQIKEDWSDLSTLRGQLREGKVEDGWHVAEPKVIKVTDGKAEVQKHLEAEWNSGRKQYVITKKEPGPEPVKAKSPLDDLKLPQMSKEHLKQVEDLTRKLTNELRDELWTAHHLTEQYQQGTLGEKESGLDELARGKRDKPIGEDKDIGQRTHDHFQPVRDLLKQLVGDHVTLYRGADAVGGVQGKKLSSYAADPKVAAKFLEGYDVHGEPKQKVLKEVSVPVDAIYMAIRSKDRPLEFKVDNEKLPKHLSTNTLSFQENARRKQLILCPIQADGGDGDKAGHWVVVLEVRDGYVVVQDPSISNILEDADHDYAASGKVMIEEEAFDEAWRDVSADGTEYNHYGIVVSREAVENSNPEGCNQFTGPGCLLSVRRTPPADKQEARERFESVAKKLSGRFEESEDCVIHLPGGRHIDLMLLPDWKTINVDFGVEGRSNKSVEQKLDPDSLRMLRKVKDVVLRFHKEGFKISAPPSDQRRRELYDDWMTKLGFKKEEGSNVWNLSSHLTSTNNSYSQESVRNAVPDALNVFQQWLKQQMGQLIVGKTQEQMWDAYIQAGVKKGMARAFDDVRKPKSSNKTLDFYNGSKQEFLKSSFGQPVAVDKVRAMASQTFDELEGVTDEMSVDMGRILTDGLVQGQHPNVIAKTMSDEVDVGFKRAKVISQHRLLFAHNEGQLLALENLGVDKLGVDVEFTTSGLPTVCPECADLEGEEFTIEEAHGVLPYHVGCKCVWRASGDVLVGNLSVDNLREPTGNHWDDLVQLDLLLNANAFVVASNHNHDTKGRFSVGQQVIGDLSEGVGTVVKLHPKERGVTVQLEDGRKVRHHESAFVAKKETPANPVKVGEPDRVGSVSYVKHVVDAVTKAGESKGGMAPLHLVRKHLTSVGVASRDEQDAAIHSARKSGVVTAAGLEGRHGTTQEERDAAIKEEGGHPIGYLMLREKQ